MYQRISQSNNPDEVFKTMLGDNQKAYNQIMDIWQKSGGNLEKAITQLAIQNGINQTGIPQMMSQLKNLVM